MGCHKARELYLAMVGCCSIAIPAKVHWIVKSPVTTTTRHSLRTGKVSTSTTAMIFSVEPEYRPRWGKLGKSFETEKTEKINTRNTVEINSAPAAQGSGGWFSRALDWVQGGLDALSLALDATGIGATISWIPDVLNAGISVARRDWVGAGLSLAAAVPFIGATANAARLGRIEARALKGLARAHSEAYVYKLIDEFGDVVKYGITSNPASRVTKYARELKDSFVEWNSYRNRLAGTKHWN